MSTANFGIAPPQTTVTFQEGLSGYAGTQDTYILETSPTSSFGTLDSFEWDTEDTAGNANSRKYGLLRFENIFGSGAGQIPVGSTIISAALEYTIWNNTANGPGSLNPALVSWDENTTYNTFGSTAGVQPEDFGAKVADVPGAAAQAYSVDVTASLAAWVSNPALNLGWLFTAAGTDGVDARSSEYATMSQRPKLTVVYISSATQYALTVNAGTGGTVTKNPDRTSYDAGTQVTLTAVPNSGYTFSNWSGSLTGSTNPATITMDGNKTVSATFTLIPPTCYALTLSHTGQGSDPVPSPTNSTGCATGQYVAGASIALTAAPASGYQVGSWTGTINDSSTASTNSLTMPASAHSASVNYAQIPPSNLVCESFNSYTPGSTIGTYTGWWDGGAGPVVTTGNGVASSIGLAAAGNVYHWTAHPFNWNAADFQKFIVQHDFQSSGSSTFDDDRIGWTING